MKSYELTDEEVMEATQVDMILDDGSLNVDQGYLTGRIQVAHAAQKKLLGDIESHVIYHNKAPFIPSKYWQSLLKAFGIKDD
jgi:hypothetical protein